MKVVANDMHCKMKNCCKIAWLPKKRKTRSNLKELSKELCVLSFCRFVVFAFFLWNTEVEEEEEKRSLFTIWCFNFLAGNHLFDFVVLLFFWGEFLARNPCLILFHLFSFWFIFLDEEEEVNGKGGEKVGGSL